MPAVLQQPITGSDATYTIAGSRVALDVDIGSSVVINIGSVSAQVDSVYVQSGTQVGTYMMNASGVAPGEICAGNSTTDTLSANGSFVGSWSDVKDFSHIITSIRTDADGVSDSSLHLDFSQDGVTKDVHEEYGIGSNAVGTVFTSQPSCQYYRVIYYNGATPQGLMRLQSICRPNFAKASSHRIDDPISDENDAELVKAVLTAKLPGGTYTNIDATNGGNLKVSVEDWNGVTGSVYNVETVPTAAINNNPLLNLVYISSGTSTGITTGSQIGSIVQFIGTGSYVQVLTYTADNLTSVGSWS